MSRCNRPRLSVLDLVLLWSLWWFMWFFMSRKYLYDHIRKDLERSQCTFCARSCHKLKIGGFKFYGGLFGFERFLSEDILSL